MKCISDKCINEDSKLENTKDLDKTYGKSRDSIIFNDSNDFTNDSNSFEDSKSVNTYISEGKQLYEIGEYEDALYNFKEALKQSNNNNEIYNLIGTTLHRIGLTNEAESAYKKAIDINENHFKANFNLANLYLDMKEYKKSIQYFKMSSYLNTIDSDIYVSLAVAYQRDKQIDQAIESCLTAIELDKLNILSHYNLGLIYQEIGQLDNAISKYRDVLDIDTFHIDSLFNLAAAYQDRGLKSNENCVNDFNKALDCYLRILNIDDTIVEVHKGIQYVKEAIHHYDKIY